MDGNDHRLPPQADSPMTQAGAPKFLWIIVGIMTTIELGLTASEFFWSIDHRSTTFLLGAFWQPIFSGTIQPIYPGQTLLMFITYAFLHGGILHLAMNSVILLSLGKFSSIQVGVQKTLLVLFLSAVVGAACFGFISGGNVPMIGASGAVFGLIGIWQATEYQMRRTAGVSIQPIIMGIFGLIVANILIFVMLSGGLAWETHFGGWLTGWLSGFIFTRRR